MAAALTVVAAVVVGGIGVCVALTIVALRRLSRRQADLPSLPPADTTADEWRRLKVSKQADAYDWFLTDDWVDS